MTERPLCISKEDLRDMWLIWGKPKNARLCPFGMFEMRMRGSASKGQLWIERDAKGHITGFMQGLAHSPIFFCERMASTCGDTRRFLYRLLLSMGQFIDIVLFDSPGPEHKVIAAKIDYDKAKQRIHVKLKDFTPWLPLLQQ